MVERRRVDKRTRLQAGGTCATPNSPNNPGQVPHGTTGREVPHGTTGREAVEGTEILEITRDRFHTEPPGGTKVPSDGTPASRIHEETVNLGRIGN